MHVGCNSIVESWLEAAYNKDRQATTKSPTSTSHSQKLSWQTIYINMGDVKHRERNYQSTTKRRI